MLYFTFNGFCWIMNCFVWSSSKQWSVYLVLFIKTTPRPLPCFRMHSLHFLIVDQLLSCICRERVLCYIFRKCFEALFLNTINRSLVCVIYLLKYSDKTVQTQYLFCCYWIYKEYGDLICMKVQCILLLLFDMIKSCELYFWCT